MRRLKAILFRTILVTSVALAFTAPALASADAEKPVRELLQLLEVEKSIETSLMVTAEALVGQASLPEASKAKLENFLRETIGYKAIESDLIRLYQKNFTSSEIQDMIQFYKTPTGRKLAKTLPVLMLEGAQIGQEKILVRQEELQKLISEIRNSETKKPAKTKRSN